MLRVLILVITFVFSAYSTVEAQSISGYLEVEHVVVESEGTPQINVYVRGHLKGAWGWSAWTLTSQPWSEAYAGITYTPAKWVDLSLGVGLETADSPERFGASLWLGRGRFAILSMIEDGGSGEWHKNVATFQATPRVAIGMFNQSFVGTGPYAEVKLGKVTAWVAYMLDVEKSFAAGGKLGF